jgi:hypothetical protein
MDIPAIVSSAPYIAMYICIYKVFWCLSEQCGHITVPDDVQATRIIISQGIQQATLSCTKPGYIFAGQRDPTTQLCIKGQWTYEEKNYEIPSCQGNMFTTFIT